MKQLPIKLRRFLLSIYSLTLASLIFFIFTGNIYIENKINIKSFLFFIALTVLTETFTVVFRNMSFSTTFAVTVASFLLLGTLYTIIITIIGFTLRVIKTNGVYKHIFNTPWYGTLFNYCILTLPVIYAGFLFSSLGGSFDVLNLPQNLTQIIVFSITYFFINTFIISTLYSIQTNKRLIYSFINNIKLGLLNFLIMTPLGLILAYLSYKFGYSWVIIFIFPIVLSRYTFSLYIDSKNQYIQTVDVLMRSMEARDKYTEGHSKRVSDLSIKIATELKYNDWKIDKLKIAALLHDVGKLGIAESILNKPGKLSTEEFEVIKSHPDLGYNILKDIKNLENVIPIVRHHHERYDGKGYPDNKKADELSLDVFIIQLADSIDAMATDRPYRKALSKEEILDEIRKNSGTQFHPKVAEAYLKMIERESKVS